MTGNSDATNQLLEQAARGDPGALGTLLVRHGDRLRRMVALRMDRRLQGRIDASDVIQEAYLEASARLAEYLRDPSMPFFLWLRFLTGQKLVTLHRHHLGVQMCDAGQEVALCRGPLPGGTIGVSTFCCRKNEPSPISRLALNSTAMQRSADLSPGAATVRIVSGLPYQRISS